MSERVLFVVNPASAGGKTARLWDELQRPVENVVGPFDVLFTARAGHATVLAREAALAGRRRIVAVGGDGTFSEVAAGVLGAKSDAAVGVIHQGTGGDFRRSLGLEHRLDRYLAAIARDAPKAVDAGRVTCVGRDGAPHERFFVNVASLGMGGLVDKYVGEGTRLLGGTATYLAASLKALANGAVGRLEVRLTLDGVTRTEQLETRLIAVCNGRFFGGGMQIAPMASLDDGAFDVIAIAGAHRLPALAAMGAVYRGKHLTLKGVTHWRASEVALRLFNVHDADRFLLDVDGEWAGQAPVTISVLPRALRVLV